MCVSCSCCTVVVMLEDLYRADNYYVFSGCGDESFEIVWRQQFQNFTNLYPGDQSSLDRTVL